MSTATSSTVIHPTAVVDARAELGAGVEVGPYCVIEAGASIGAGCVLGAYVHVFGCVTLGAGSSVRSGSVLGGEPQDIKYHGEPARVIIGERCRIHEHVTVHRGTGANTQTVVGDEVMLMAGSHIGHNCRVANNVILVNGAMLAGHVQVGERAFISGGAAVHQFCRVGRLTLVGGACMATKDLPPFSICVGSYPVRWRAPNTIGLRRNGFSSEQRTLIRRALANLFRSHESRAETAKSLLSSPCAEVVEIARFVLDSKRGMCSGLRGGGSGAELDD
jgi:UDP-N-acetylglucosamine acyltransferase